MSERRVKASLTVEAAFVVPVIVLSLVAVVWIVFFLVNNIKAASDADGIIYRLERELAESDRKKSELKRDISEEITGFALAETESAILEKKNDRIEVKICVRMFGPQNGLLGRLVSKIGIIRVERTEYLPERQDTTRKISAVTGLVEEIKEYLKK